MNKKRNIMLSIITLSIIILFIANPKESINATLNGIVVWATALLPALFPFFVFTRMLTELRFIETLSVYIAPITKKLFNTPGISAYVYVMSIFSGYPVGAKITSDLYEKGIISQGQACRITTFSSTSGPLFVIGTVGIGMFSNKTLGLVVLVCHFISALFNGLIYRNYKLKDPTYNTNIFTSKTLNQKVNNRTNNDNKTADYNIADSKILSVATVANNYNAYSIPIKTNSLNNSINKSPKSSFASSPTRDNILETIIYTSIKSILIIGGYIAIFFMLITMLNYYNILQPINIALGSMFEFFGISSNVSYSIVNGVIEITKGCLDLSNVANISNNLKAILTTFIITFGGFSTHMQALTFLRKFKINIGFYLMQKVTHTIIATLLCVLATFIIAI